MSELFTANGLLQPRLRTLDVQSEVLFIPIPLDLKPAISHPMPSMPSSRHAASSELYSHQTVHLWTRLWRTPVFLRHFNGVAMTAGYRSSWLRSMPLWFVSFSFIRFDEIFWTECRSSVIAAFDFVGGFWLLHATDTHPLGLINWL